MLAVQLQKGYRVDEVAASRTIVVCTHANRLLASLVGLEELTRHLSCAQACGRPPGSRSSGGFGGFDGFGGSGGARSSCRPSPLLKDRRAWPHRRLVVDSFVVVAAAAQTHRSWFRSSSQAHRVRSWVPLGQGERPRVQRLRRRTFNRVSASHSGGVQNASSAYRSAKRSSSAASAIVKDLCSDRRWFAAIAQQLQARFNKP
jgi:hypothetical protein